MLRGGGGNRRRGFRGSSTLPGRQLKAEPGGCNTLTSLRRLLLYVERFHHNFKVPPALVGFFGV